MASSKGSRKRGAMKRAAGYAAARRRAAGDLRGIDAAVAKFRACAQAGEQLIASQLALLEQHGGVNPPAFD